jgi:tape measure domain-containing protein
VAGETQYTIRLIDQASASSARVKSALDSVAGAAQRTEQAFMGTDRAYQAVAREAERQARAQLKVARALDAVDKHALSSQRTLDKYGKRTAPRLTKDTTTAFERMKGGISATTAFIGAAVGGMAVRVGRDLLEAAGGAQTLERNFERIAPGELKEVRDLVQRLGLDLDAGEKAALKLRTTFDKFTANKFLEFFRGVNLDPGELDRATLAITQIQGRGKLQAEEMNQFVEAVPGVDRGRVVDQIAKEMGIARAEAAAKLQKGQVASDVGIRALVFATLESRKMTDPTAEGGRGYGGLATAISESSGDISVKLAGLDNSITRIKRSLGENLDKSGFVEELDKLLKKLEEFSTLDFGIFDRLMGIWKTLNGDYSVDASKIFGVDGDSALGKILDFKPGEFIGNAIGAGVATGIEQSKGQAEAAAANLANGVILQSKDAFGIHSPSTVFADQGYQDVMGLVTGIEDNQDLAFAAAESMADGAIAEAEMAAATGSPASAAGMANVGAAAGNALVAGGGGAAGPVTVQVAISIDGSRSPAETAEALKDFFSSADFVALFERAVEGSGA